MFLWVVKSLLATCLQLTLAEDLLEEARKRADVAVIESTDGFPEYLAIAEIATESSPDSPLFFNSKTRMEIFRIPGLQVEQVSCVPDVLFDDRPGISQFPLAKPHAPNFARIENWKRIHFDGKTFDLLDYRGQSIDPEYIQPDDRMANLGHSACLTPWDWILLRPGVIEMNANDYSAKIFPEKKKCFVAKKGKERELITLWAFPAQEVRSVEVVVFDDFLIKNYAVYYFGRPIDLQNLNLAEGRLLGSTETVWGKCGAISVPKTVLSKIRSTPNSEMVTYKVNIDFHSVGDLEFETYKQEMLKVKEAATKSK